MPEPTTPPVAAHYSDPRCDICDQLMEYSAGMWICTSRPSCCEVPSPPAAAQCPWCGCTADIAVGGSDQYFVRCDDLNCAVEGPIHICPETAINVWNRVAATHAAALRVVEAARVLIDLQAFTEKFQGYALGGDAVLSMARSRQEIIKAIAEALAAFDAAKGGE